MASVELFNDTSEAIPHTFIVITHNDGTKEGWGFYPATDRKANDSGILKDNTAHPYTSRSGAVDLTNQQYERLLNYVKQTKDYPPPYAVTYGSMCTTWAVNALVVANGGGDPRLPDMKPTDFWSDLKESIMWNPWMLEIKIQVNRFWNRATTPTARDPLAIDLDRDGIETVGFTPTAPILFDHNADGARTGTGWLKGDDAWLVLDRNGNGLIDSGRELFGVDTQITSAQGVTRTAQSGFEALSALDSNGDKVFNSQDTAFQQVRLWQDLNQDGVSQTSELSTLAQKGVVSISLTPTASTTNLGNGNVVTSSATVELAGGLRSEVDGVSVAGATANNLDLADNPFYRQFADSIPLTDAARALPEMAGSGWVRDLREAMSQQSPQAQKLATLVDSFAKSTTRREQVGQLDKLLEAWAQSSGTHNTAQAVEAISQQLVSETSTSKTYRVTTLSQAAETLSRGGNWARPMTPCASGLTT